MFFGARRLFSILVTKKRKRTGMTRLGSPGVSPRSVSGFFGPFRPENPETDWDDKPGLPRCVIPVHFRFFLTKIEKSRLAPKNIPNGYFYKKNSTAELEVQLIVFFIKQLRKKRKRTGMTRLGFRPENPETDWDDKPGLPRVVIPIHFGVFWPISARQARNGLG